MSFFPVVIFHGRLFFHQCQDRCNGIVTISNPLIDIELSRVDRFLPMLQVEVCFLRFHLVSRRCHNISTIHQLFPASHRTGHAVFPHPALQTGSHHSRVNPTIDLTFGFSSPISDSRFSFVDNLPGSGSGTCFTSSIHPFVNPFPPPALPGLTGTMG